MRRILFIILCIIIAGGAEAQKKQQQVIVKTPGRLQKDGSVVPGKRIAQAYTTIKDNNTYESDTQGEFVFVVGADGIFRVERVEKSGYQLVDLDFILSQQKYKAEPLYVLLEQPDTQLADKLATERKIRRQLNTRLQQAEERIDALLAEKKITEEEYRAELQKLYDNQEKSEKLISDMAEEYSKMDFDQVNEFNREVAALILEGELDRADSLLMTKGSIEERIEELNEHRKLNEQAREDLEQSEAFATAKMEDIAEQCYQKHQIHALKNEHTEAAYYLEQRAKLDPINIEWQLEAGIYIQEYLADYDKALKIYERTLQSSAISHRGGQKSQIYMPV